MPTVEASYDYTNETGDLLFQVRRMRNEDGTKDFNQRRPIPGHPNEWAWSLQAGRYQRKPTGTWERLPERVTVDGALELPEVRSVPYQLKLLADHPHHAVVVVEGEKDVQTLQALFKNRLLIATTNAGGAGKWKLSMGGFLSGRRVAVIPDNDTPGLVHAMNVAASALAFGAKAIRMVRWPADVPEGFDVTDWLQARMPLGTTADKLHAVTTLINTAELWEPKHQGKAA